MNDQTQTGPSFYFVAVAAAFITCLLTANIMAAKLISVAGLILPAAIIIFPVSYIVGDVLTEVYGFASARRVIWLGFAMNLVMVAALLAGQALPAAPFWPHQQAYAAILGQTPRILVASFLAYLVGEFANSFVLARMKVATNGRHLWARTIGSTLVGQGLDSAVFITLAFAGIMPGRAVFVAVVTQWLVKSAYEALATPLTYQAVALLKRKEGIDVYDRGTSMNPFRL